jgi:2-haloalkanoic acid dehalogenase type II
MSLNDFSTLTFDVIGTLINFEAGILQWMRPRLQAAKADVTDDEILQAHARAEVNLQNDSSELELHKNMHQTEMLHHIWAYVAEKFGVEVHPDDNASLDESWGEWPAFPDSVEALRYLHQHYRLVALTNAGRASALKMAATLQQPFDLILTAEDIGATKPDKRVFKAAMATLKQKYDVEQRDILHVAQSQYHDIKPAKALGFKTAWIERRHDQLGSGGTPETEEKATPDWRATSLAGLVEEHKQAAAAASRA